MVQWQPEIMMIESSYVPSAESLALRTHLRAITLT